MKDKKVLATYSLTKENKRYIEDQAKKEGRSVSSFLDRLITKVVQENER